MDEENGGGMNKLSGIRQIVRLKESIQQWQGVTTKWKKIGGGGGGGGGVGGGGHENQSHGSLSPAINKRLTNVVLCCDSDEESCQSPEHPSDVPKGYLAVYVGPELRRFIIPTTYLSHSLFKVLLEKAEEEFGFDHTGGLTFPCEIETFKYLLNCMDSQLNKEEDHPHHHSPPPAAASSLSMEG